MDYLKSINHSVLPKEVIYDLINKAQSGDLKSRNKIIEHSIGLVLKTANMYSRIAKMPVDDLVQEGIFGLIVAIDKFDTSLNWAFTTYAGPAIKSYIRHYILQNRSVVAKETETNRKQPISKNDWNVMSIDAKQAAAKGRDGSEDIEMELGFYTNETPESILMEKELKGVLIKHKSYLEKTVPSAEKVLVEKIFNFNDLDYPSHAVLGNKEKKKVCRAAMSARSRKLENTAIKMMRQELRKDLRILS